MLLHLVCVLIMHFGFSCRVCVCVCEFVSLYALFDFFAHNLCFFAAFKNCVNDSCSLIAVLCAVSCVDILCIFGLC